TALSTGGAPSQRTNASRRTPRCGSVESPPPTRRLKPISPVAGWRTAVRPTALVSGYEHHVRQPAIETLNFRGRLWNAGLPLSICVPAWTSGEVSVSSAASMPARGQQVTLLWTAPHVPSLV